MNCKRIYAALCYVFVICCAITNQGCSKYNEPVPLEFAALKPKIGSPEYYEALRAYKQSDHAICFGWWGESDGENGASSDVSLRYIGLPDSMDIVSLWGGFPRNPAVFDEMQYVRKVKGTKFVMVMFGSGVQALMVKNDSALFVVAKDTMTAIDNVVKAIADTVDKYQIDGFDLDYETAYGDNTFFGKGGGTVTNDRYTQRLFKSFSKYFGPMSGTDKVLIVDGQFDRGIEPYINYLAQQSYNSGSASALQSRFTTFGVGILPSKKFIVTENMQQYGPTGVSFMYNGVNVGSVLGMAYWNPVGGRKGGFGAYIMESDAMSDPSVGHYSVLRKGIQIQNPALY